MTMLENAKNAGPGDRKRQWNLACGSILIFFLARELTAFIGYIAAALYCFASHGWEMEPAMNAYIALATSMSTVYLLTVAGDFAGVLAAAFLILPRLDLSLGFGKKTPFFSAAPEAVSDRRVSFEPAVWIAFGFALQMLGSWIAGGITLLLEGIGLHSAMPDFAGSDTLAGTVLALLLTCVAAPVCEEIIFRGILQRTFMKAGLGFGALASAALFALYHGNLPQAVGSFFIGLSLSYVMLRSGKVIHCILLHALLNGAAMVINLTGAWVSLDAAVILQVSLGLLAILASIAFLILFRGRLFAAPAGTAQKSGYPSERKGGWKMLLGCWTFWIVVVIELGMALMSFMTAV